MLLSLRAAEVVAGGELYLAHKYLPVGDVAEVRKSVGDGLRTALYCTIGGVNLEGAEGKAEKSGDN